MKAIDFIKEHGLRKAKECLSNCACPDDKWFIHEGDLVSDFDFDELKRLVESVDLIRKVSGVSNAKLILSDMDYDSVDWDENQFSYHALLKQAIADYEVIYGGEHV